MRRGLRSRSVVSFLRGLGLTDDRLLRLARSLGRWRETPNGPEEEALHDAELLEQVGVVAAAGQIWRAGRKRTPLARAIPTLSAGPAPERFRTEEGRRMAEAARREAEGWLEVLARASDVRRQT